MTTPAPQVPVPPSAPLFAPPTPPVPPTIVRTARALPVDAVIGGLAFHRLNFARRRSGWWIPLVTGILGLAIYLGLLVVVMVVIGIALFRDPERLDDLARLGQSGGVDMGDPLMVAILLGTIALMLPAYILASLIVNGRRVGLVSSAAGRLRWRWMLLCGALAVGVSAVLTVVGLLLPGGMEEPATGGPAPTWPITLVVVLLLVPVQAAAEEYIFRGYLMQSIGRWLRHPAFAILLPVPLFVLGHGYDLLGQIGVGLFAVAAAGSRGAPEDWRRRSPCTS